MELAEKSTKKLKQAVKIKSNKLLQSTSSRHQATWDDVDFLDALEMKYFENKDLNNLAIASEIRIFDDYIDVSWVIITRFDLELPEDPGNWIYVNPNNKWTLVDYKFTKHFAVVKGYKIPTESQIESLILSMPWNTIEKKEYNAKNILNLSNNWYYNADNDNFHWDPKFWQYWLANTWKSLGTSLRITKIWIELKPRVDLYNGYSVRYILN